MVRFHNHYEYQTFEMDLIGLAASDTQVSRMKLNEFRERQSTGLSTVVTPISLAAGAGSVQPVPAPTAFIFTVFPAWRIFAQILSISSN
ncbi:hypothetical protein J7I43_19845 [Chitinophaga sp. MAH-28]|uniref:Uncharacterized protein n=1 Tax=Chitinophaga chungangae TaxID=2821488 RepID=A0ABS3YIM1_9BACT|nr:hypothetical protein [Chitinophaga chungangae]